MTVGITTFPAFGDRQLFVVGETSWGRSGRRGVINGQASRPGLTRMVSPSRGRYTCKLPETLVSLSRSAGSNSTAARHVQEGCRSRAGASGPGALPAAILTDRRFGFDPPAAPA